MVVAVVEMVGEPAGPANRLHVIVRDRQRRRFQGRRELPVSGRDGWFGGRERELSLGHVRFESPQTAKWEY